MVKYKSQLHLDLGQGKIRPIKLHALLLSGVKITTADDCCLSLRQVGCIEAGFVFPFNEERYKHIVSAEGR